LRQKQLSAPKQDLTVPVETIQQRIYLMRGQKVMFDRDLAELYQVSTGNLNLAVRRNPTRFPADFMFQLTKEEYENLRLQTAISSWGGRRYMPFAFTEHGVAMLSSVLSSDRAVQMNISIVRAFVRLRDMLATHKHLATRIGKLEINQKQHASVITILAEEIEDIKRLPETPKRRIGFKLAGATALNAG
jgi:ORF6N domain